RRNVFRSGIAQDVSVPAKSLDRNELQGLINEKACKDHCYFLSITNLKSIGRERGIVNGLAFACSISKRRNNLYQDAMKTFDSISQPRFKNPKMVESEEE
ncbi:hypothetical protein CUMW_256250, partial [Citrus unshiu]